MYLFAIIIIGTSFIASLAAITTNNFYKFNDAIMFLSDRLNTIQIKPIKKQTFTVEFTKNKSDQPALIIYLKNVDELLGIAGLHYDRANKSAYLIHLSVISEYQNQGLGVILWDKIIEELRKLDIKKLNFTAVPPMDGMNQKFEVTLNRLIKWYTARGAKIITITDSTPYFEYNII